MATDYFAHAVYGVLLEEKDLKDFREAYAQALADIEEAGGLDDVFEERQAAIKQAAGSLAGWLEGLRARYGAPPEATLLWTGDEDMRPGRCHVNADRWVLGVGYVAYPGGGWPEKLSKKFQKHAEWYSWVEAG
jgi:hypothetical protein